MFSSSAGLINWLSSQLAVFEYWLFIYYILVQEVKEKDVSLGDIPLS